MAAGHPEWIGPCVHGKANGLGIVRVADNHGGAQIFYGLLRAGIPIEGLIGDSTGAGYKIVPGFDSSLHIDQSLPAELQQDPRYWKEAATAAHTAAAHYQAAGNAASASFLPIASQNPGPEAPASKSSKTHHG